MKNPQTVKEILEDINSTHGTDKAIELIDQLYEHFLAVSDNGECFDNHWLKYNLTKQLKSLILQAKTEFDLKH